MLSPIHHILVPTDHSPPAHHAIGYAADLAEMLGAEVELLHAYDDTPRASRSVSVAPRRGLEALDIAASAHVQLSREAQALRSRGLDVTETLVGPTSPAPAILSAASNADLIVMGIRERSLGGVSGAVARSVPVPLVVLGPETGGRVRGLKILVPVDLARASGAALLGARSLVSRLGGSVEVVHAVADEIQAVAWGGEAVEATDELPGERALRYVERFIADTGGADVPIQIRMVEGPVATTVARVAGEDAPDLVVAGRPTERPEAVDRLLDALSEAARCPAMRIPI